MEILIVTAGFFPGQKYGGPPISIDNFCTLMVDYKCYIVTRNHDMGDKEKYLNIKSGWNERENCKVLYLNDTEYGYRKFEKVIKEIKPKIIYLQGLFQDCIIPCLYLAKKYNIPVLLAPRGELCQGALKKKYKKIPYIIFLKLFRLTTNILFQSTSDEETKVIIKFLKVNKKRIFYLPNIPSIPKGSYKYKVKNKNEANLIFISRIVTKKNLDYALECLKTTDGNVNFDIYGAIEDKEYWKKCQSIIEVLPKNIRVVYKGNINHNIVHEIFSKYDAFFFPTKSENYGHVIVESLFAGCPLIISDNTPWNDISKYNAGWTISLDDKDIYIDAIQKIIKLSNEEMMRLRNNCKKYITDKMNVNILRIEYEKVFEEINDKRSMYGRTSL